MTYAYDNSGALATVFDSESGITSTYYYDLTDRMVKVTEKGDHYSHSIGYEYDTINNLTQVVETVNGVAHTTSYTYDLDNRVTGITTDGVTKTYTYDAYGRVSQQVTTSGGVTILTETYTYTPASNGQLSAQVATYRTQSALYDVTYTYTYDDNGNILSVSDGTNTTSYVYDSANQLIRENDQAANKTTTWTYDNAGNILQRNEYAYTTAENPGTPTDTVNYTYGGDTDWGDLLTAYDGNAITYDAIGNPTQDYAGNTYTWQQGRELASMSGNGVTWNYTYDADGMRTSRSNGTTTYRYIYSGTKLLQMEISDTSTGAVSHTLSFTYDAQGTPQTVTYDDTVYYYATNLQGDIVAILNASGETVVSYSYDAWGRHTSGDNGTGTLASTLGKHNPLRYRGYVYDQDTGFYYLQSRYYDPAICRFINADALASTGQGIIGCNMFAYCGNNPITGCDPCGTCIHNWKSYDCEKCSKFWNGAWNWLLDACNTITGVNSQQAQLQTQIIMQQNEMVANAAEAVWDAYMWSYNQQQQAQLQQAQMLLDRFDTPEDIEQSIDIIDATAGFSIAVYEVAIIATTTNPTVGAVCLAVLGVAYGARAVYRACQ